MIVKESRNDLRKKRHARVRNKVSGTAEFDELEPINIIAYSGSNYPRTSEELQFFH